MRTLKTATIPTSRKSSARNIVFHGLLLLILLSIVPPSHAGNLEFESSTRQVTVLELFTSHGCSSCPPADAWLRKMVDHPGLWRQVVPLSFHVDYWDGLGWQDRFARAEFSARQRAYRSTGGLSAVYTPGFVLNGREWRDWFIRYNRSSSELPEFSPGQTVGKLHLEVIPGEWVQAHFGSLKEYGPLQAHLAILGFGLSSPIGGGENRGRTLKEDFVVLGVSDSALSDDKTATRRWRIAWPRLLPAAKADRYAVAVWLSEGDDPKPVQAAAGWLR